MIDGLVKPESTVIPRVWLAVKYFTYNPRVEGFIQCGLLD